MAINFDALPTSAPNAIVPEGYYIVKIIKAEMKPAFNKMDPDELNLTYDLSDLNGKALGMKLFDKLKESDKPAQQYKLQRFCRAIDLELHGMVELSDVAKLVTGKQLIIDVEHSDFGGKTRAQVSLFNHDCFYKVSEATELLGGPAVLEVDNDDDLPFITGDTPEQY